MVFPRQPLSSSRPTDPACGRPEDKLRLGPTSAVDAGLRR